MTVKGFNIQVKNEDKKLTITNTLQSGGVTIQLHGSTTLNYGYDGEFINSTSELTMTDEDFIRFVSVLKNAQEKLLEQNKKVPIKKVTITDSTNAQTETKKATKKAPKKAKKGGK